MTDNAPLSQSPTSGNAQPAAAAVQRPRAGAPREQGATQRQSRAGRSRTQTERTRLGGQSRPARHGQRVRALFVNRETGFEPCRRPGPQEAGRGVVSHAALHCGLLAARGQFPSAQFGTNRSPEPMRTFLAMTTWFGLGGSHVCWATGTPQGDRIPGLLLDRHPRTRR